MVLNRNVFVSTTVNSILYLLVLCLGCLDTLPYFSLVVRQVN